MLNSFSIMSTNLFIDDVYSDGHHCILIKFYIYILHTFSFSVIPLCSQFQCVFCNAGCMERMELF